jgi:Mrp family chromosome partitioning ATPase
MILSTIVDGVVLVVGSDNTPKNQVKAACTRLEYARAKIFGVVLNKVDLRSQDYKHYYHFHEYYNGVANESDDEAPTIPTS